MLDLPITNPSPWFAFACELEAVTYRFTFRWNARAESWFMDIADGNGTALASSLRVAVNTPLLGPLKGKVGCPPGELIAYDTQGRDLDPGFADLGTRVALAYLTVEDLAEL